MAIFSASRIWIIALACLSPVVYRLGVILVEIEARGVHVWSQVDKSKIVEMFSQQGEKVEMEHPVEARGVFLPSVAIF